MDGEEMTQDLGVAFFTDSNVPSLIPNPFWGDLFDYYDVNPLPGPYVCAVPWKDKSRRFVPTSVIVTSDDPVLESGDPTPPGPIIVGKKISKTGGQGEFDNLHIAPKMVLRPENVTSHHIPKEKLAGLDRITMAPFCFHDCLHMHLRWGAADGDAQNRGWQDEETPNALAGAPLVPPNQRVTLNLMSPTSFEYTAEALGVRAGSWQIMLHHGLGYALNAKYRINVVRGGVNHGSISVSKGDWALMYWNLRWYPSQNGIQYERLSWAQGDLPKLREAGSLPQAIPKAAVTSSGG
jgi:hypothetical protein